MKTITTLIMAALLGACAARPQTQAERQCEYEARRSMAGRMGANAFEASALYDQCVAVKGGAQ
jgi:hypothetical protein